METPSESPEQRTEWNVRDSAATVVFVPDSKYSSRGTDFTIECAKKYGKPYCIIHYMDVEPSLTRDLWFVSLQRRRGRGGRDLAPDVAFDLTLLFVGVAVLRFRDFAMEGVDIFRLRWFAAPDLTLARPKAPQVAGRALGRLWLGQPMTTPMRTMRRKSSRFCALKSARTSSVNLVGITTGAFPPTLGYPQ
jgi:Circularly permutated YpsA SLOG family